MRHRKHSIKFGRQRSHYKATMRHLVTGLIVSKGITTTKVKAKQASRLADKLVTIAKDNNVSARRRAYDILQSRDLVSTLFNEIAPLFKERKGGYTRVMLTNRRRGDNAQMAILEFVEKPVTKTQKPAKAQKAEKKPEKALPETKDKVKKAPEAKIEHKKPKVKQELPEKKKEEPKKVAEPPKEPEKPKEQPEKKTGFFKRFFGKQKES